MGRTSDAKERLLEAALDLIWERSYGTVTIDAICEKAGVKKGSFYYFYDSKSELAAAALRADWETCGKPKWDATFSPSIPPLERIAGFFRNLYERQAKLREEHGCVLGCPCFSLGSEISTQDETLRVTAQEMLRTQTRYFESAIRDAQAAGLVPPGDAALKAKSLFALFEGALTQAKIQNDLEFLRILPDVAADVLGAARTAAA